MDLIYFLINTDFMFSLGALIFMYRGIDVTLSKALMWHLHKIEEIVIGLEWRH